MFKKMVLIMWMLIAVLAIGVGIYLMMHPLVALASTAWIMGVVLISSAIGSLVTYSRQRGQPGAGWQLADGILTLLLAVYVLLHQLFAIAALPYLASCWVLFFGMRKIISAIEQKHEPYSDWGWNLALGIVTLLVGMSMLSSPAMTLFSVGSMMGMLFAYRGVVTIVFVVRQWRLISAAGHGEENHF
ncbi:MAG: DUF308 domain-containing protein [Clostridiales bacterium]|nr:DUF308 domain-containing protein [Clostridiales bacterium]